MNLDGYNDVGSEARPTVQRQINYKTFQWPEDRGERLFPEVPYGWDVYHLLGDPKYCLAPMVEGSSLPNRLLIGLMGADACWTPMLHVTNYANIETYKNPYNHPDSALLSEEGAESPLPADAPIVIASSTALRNALRVRADLVTELPVSDTPVTTTLAERPLVVQFAGNDPTDLLSAVRNLESGLFVGPPERGHPDALRRRPGAPPVVAVEINFGCPQRIARRGYYGSFLQENWSLSYALVDTLYRNSRLPVLAKIRRMPEEDDMRRYVLMLEAAGASIITVHGRLRVQRGCNKGLCDWSAVSLAVRTLEGRLPVIFNGGIESQEQADRAMAETGAVAAMIGEPLLDHPAMFALQPRALVGRLVPHDELAALVRESDPSVVSLAGQRARARLAVALTRITRALYTTKEDTEDAAGLIAEFAAAARTAVAAALETLRALRQSVEAGEDAERRRELAAVFARRAVSQGEPRAPFDDTFLQLKLPDVESTLATGSVEERAKLGQKVANRAVSAEFERLKLTPPPLLDDSSSQSRSALLLCWFHILERDLSRHPDLRLWAGLRDGKSMYRVELLARELEARADAGELWLGGAPFTDAA